jgi:hypothetical protein
MLRTSFLLLFFFALGELLVIFSLPYFVFVASNNILFFSYKAQQRVWTIHPYSHAKHDFVILVETMIRLVGGAVKKWEMAIVSTLALFSLTF